ncbi:PD-(D/E)XK motif protein [Pedobacter sp. KR3-3]|uniref:PD-(D/E)XK motif protein n=1 Tax=Pedobacter albus TaxID=3113905 RepID=A0ABU7IBX5_9SPHI|nr:PD-(D/E)XK motif protein [Pedobacter sp. KR3-3]MEE1946964.1 PD-(D/E)XK motif protein [Pedobacter sp. KR3-3]
MNYKNLITETWKQLDLSGDIVSGYKSLMLTSDGQSTTPLHIFIDEKGRSHLAIETVTKIIEDPLVNGLSVTIRSYRMGDGNIRQMIDLCCSIGSYIEEFTGVIREIAECIIDKGENPVEAVTNVVRNWRIFWGNQSRRLLSEEEMIGLICELQILYHLCSINMSTALSSWTGPQMGKTDFSFTSWELEVKATRNLKIIHTINGIEQLWQSENKSLGLISFLVSVTGNDNSISLPELVARIINDYFINRPDLIIRFYELLADAGYDGIFIEQYRNFKIELLRSTFYIVGDTFPKLTPDDLIAPLNNRISGIKYNISLEGLVGKNLNEINWGDYFY